MARYGPLHIFLLTFPQWWYLGATRIPELACRVRVGFSPETFILASWPVNGLYYTTGLLNFRSNDFQVPLSYDNVKSQR